MEASADRDKAIGDASYTGLLQRTTRIREAVEAGALDSTADELEPVSDAEVQRARERGR